MTKITAVFIFAILTMTINADQASEQAEVREYLQKFDAVLQQHIDVLSTATDVQQTAAAMQSYAKAMQPMMKQSRSLKKKYPHMAGDDAELRIGMENLSTKILKVNELLGEAKQKYRDDKAFKDAEKALIKAGLFGPG